MRELNTQVKYTKQTIILLVDWSVSIAERYLCRSYLLYLIS